MKRRTGATMVPAGLFLVVIAMIGLMFVVPIFGSIDQTADNEYSEEFEGMTGMMGVLYQIAPLGVTALGLVLISVAIICFTGGKHT